jgi:putative hydrolase of the HAD superfamily
MMIEIIAFDADDTLWQNETLFHEAQGEFGQILSAWETAEKVNQVLSSTEMRNLPIYGYGIKAFTLSMLETALQVSHGELKSTTIQEILDLGRSMLTAEVRVLPHVEETLQTLSKSYRLMVITQGDLLDQTHKVSRSGLENYFSLVEVVNHKTPQAYQLLINKYHLDLNTFLMVGNSLRSDIAPVLALGGRAVHIPAGTTWELDLLADFNPDQEGFFEINSIRKLLALVNELETKRRRD